MRSTLLTATVVLASAALLLAVPCHAQRCDDTGSLDCTSAIPISCGDVVLGDNTGGATNVDQFPCVGTNTTGPEVVYEFTLPTLSNVTIQLNPAIADLDLFLLSDCSENCCVAASTSLAPEIIFECLPPGTYYIVVDGFNGAAGAFTLGIACSDCTQTTPPNDTCANAFTLGCGTIDVTTNTVGATNDYAPTDYIGGPGCAWGDFGIDGGLGPDIAYEIFLPNGGTLNLLFTKNYDGGVYIVDDCGPGGTCVASGDCFPFPCGIPLLYTNTTGAAQTLWMIVDGFGGADQGIGMLTGTIECSGACCLEDSSCELRTQANCQSPKIYIGDGTQCVGCTIDVEQKGWGQIKVLYESSE